MNQNTFKIFLDPNYQECCIIILYNQSYINVWCISWNFEQIFIIQVYTKTLVFGFFQTFLWQPSSVCWKICFSTFTWTKNTVSICFSGRTHFTHLAGLVWKPNEHSLLKYSKNANLNYSFLESSSSNIYIFLFLGLWMVLHK